MELHERLSLLAQELGREVFDDAESFRGALDDFMGEGEASTGDINLLVDVVRLGAYRHMMTLTAHGAEAGSAVEAAGALLARERGAADPVGTRWACAVLGYAAGSVSAADLQRFRTGPADPTTQTPATGSLAATLPIARPQFVPPQRALIQNPDDPNPKAVDEVAQVPAEGHGVEDSPGRALGIALLWGLSALLATASSFFIYAHYPDIPGIDLGGWGARFGGADRARVGFVVLGCSLLCLTCTVLVLRHRHDPRTVAAGGVACGATLAAGGFLGLIVEAGATGRPGVGLWLLWLAGLCAVAAAVLEGRVARRITGGLRAPRWPRRMWVALSLTVCLLVATPFANWRSFSLNGRTYSADGWGIYTPSYPTGSHRARFGVLLVVAAALIIAAMVTFMTKRWRKSAMAPVAAATGSAVAIVTALVVVLFGIDGTASREGLALGYWLVVAVACASVVDLVLILRTLPRRRAGDADAQPMWG